MDTENRVVAPLIFHRQHTFCAKRNEGKIAPTDLGKLFAHANNAFHPVEQGIWISSLGSNVDLLKAVRPVCYDSLGRFRMRCKASIWFRRPLHRRSRTIALR